MTNWTRCKLHIGKIFLIEFRWIPIEINEFQQILLVKKGQMSVRNSVAIYEAPFICVWKFLTFLIANMTKPQSFVQFVEISQMYYCFYLQIFVSQST